MVLAFLSQPGANAADDFFLFNDVFGSTNTPAGPPPWLTAEIKDVTPGKVDLTINTTGLQGSEFVSGFYLNLDPSLNPTSLTFTKQSKTGSFTDPTINLGANAFKAGGDGYYDIDLTFSTSHGGTFTLGDSITYLITGSGLDADSFEFTSVNGGGAGAYLAAAHVQSIGSDGSSSWIAPVPEPASAALILLGAGLWFCARRVFNKVG